MKLNRERLIWGSVVIALLYFLETNHTKVAEYEMLEKKYRLFNSIQQDMISEFSANQQNNLHQRYNEGFEKGKAHALIFLSQDKGLLDYKDGYHAAIEQFSEGGDEDLLLMLNDLTLELNNTK